MILLQKSFQLIIFQFDLEKRIVMVQWLHILEIEYIGGLVNMRYKTIKAILIGVLVLVFFKRFFFYNKVLPQQKRITILSVKRCSLKKNKGVY